MAKRPSVQEILEAARKGGPAKREAQPEAAAPTPATEEVGEVEASAVEPEAAPAQPAPAAVSVPSPSTLGRPLTLKEKLAAARAGGAATTAPAAAVVPAPARTDTVDEPVKAAAETKPAFGPPPAKPLGRPLTLQEKLAAARGSASAAPAAGPAAKAAPPKSAAAPAAKTAGSAPCCRLWTRSPTLVIWRRPCARPGPSKPRRLRPRWPTRRPPSRQSRPSRNGQAADCLAQARQKRCRGRRPGPSRPDRSPRLYDWQLLHPWVALGWTAFTAGCVAFTAMMGRFMFPNVLAEPPSTIKIGVPINYDPNDVNEKFKAESGFWVVPVDSLQWPGHHLRASNRFARTWAARPTGWPTNRSSSARATAAAFTSLGSISRAPPLGPWSGSRSHWPTTGRSWSTRARNSSKS